MHLLPFAWLKRMCNITETYVFEMEREEIEEVWLQSILCIVVVNSTEFVSLLCNSDTIQSKIFYQS